MNNNKKTKLNFIVLFLYQIIVIILGLLVPKLFLNRFGSEVNGLINSINQFISYLMIFEAGIQSVATQSLYRTIGQSDKKSTNEILSAVNKNYRKIGILYFFGLLSLALIYPIFVTVSSIGYIEIALIILFSGLANVFSFFVHAKYRILLAVDGKSFVINGINICTTLLNNAIKIILLLFTNDVLFIIIASFVVALIPAFSIMLVISRGYKWIDLSEIPNYSALRQNKAALIHQISGLIFSSTDIIILTIFCDLKVVSVYTVYKMVCDYMMQFIKMPFTSFSFRLGQAYNVDKSNYSKKIDLAEVTTSTLAFSLFAVTFCLLPTFVSIYTKGVTDINYTDTKLAFLFVVCQLLNYMRHPMTSTITYAGHFQETVSRTILEAVINLTVSIACVQFFGIYGVLFGTVCALSYRTADIIVYANKRLLGRSPKKTFNLYLILWVCFILTVIINSALGIVINSTFTSFITSGIIYTIVICFLYFSIVSIFFKEESKTLIRIVSQYLKETIWKIEKKK